VPDLPPNHSLETLRAWTVTALYAAMALLSVMLLYGLYVARDQLMENGVSYYASAVACAASVYFNAAAATRFFHALRQTGRAPALRLLPFLFLALAMAITGKLFTTLG